MTETDITRRPLAMPEKFIPYLEKHRIYKLFKDMLQDLIINLPKDHLKHMKVFLNTRLHTHSDVNNVIVLVSPLLKFDVNKLVRDLIKDLGYSIITRRYVLDQYEKHDDYIPGCVSAIHLAEVTKILASREPSPVVGWLMFDHPCTLREARYLQQVGVLPTVTIVLSPPPPQAPPIQNPHTPLRNFFQQDFEGLKFAYKATLKEVHVLPGDDEAKISKKCFNAIRAMTAGAQGPGQGHHVVGAPGVYRVLLIGPMGSGRHTQAEITSRHFGLVYINFDNVYNEALRKKDEIGEKLRNYGCSHQLKADIAHRRILCKDCIDRGWIMTGYPTSAQDIEFLETTKTPPNRIIFLNLDWASCKTRVLSRGIDYCTGKPAAAGGPRVMPDPRKEPSRLENELDTYFSETLAELRAAGGSTAVEIDAKGTLEEVQTRIQAAIIAAPAFSIEYATQIRNACAD